MMEDMTAKFKETESKYNRIKKQHRLGEITTEQVKVELKRLMLQDETGRYWMLGGKSGNWYVHDGTQWIEADPYEQYAAEPEQEPASAGIASEISTPDREPAVSTTAAESAVSTKSTEYKESSESTGHTEADEFNGYRKFRESSAVIPVSTISLESTGYESAESTKSVESMASMESEEEPFMLEKKSDRMDMDVEVHSYSDSEYDYEEESAAAQVDQAAPVEDTREYYTLDKEKRAETAAEEAGREEEEEELILESTAVKTAEEEEEKAPAPDYVNCKMCKSRIPPYAVYCTFCGAHQKGLDLKPADKPLTLKKELEGELLVKYIKVFSFLFFLGGVGIIVGIVIGALFGVFKDFIPALSDRLPLMLSETRGGIAGGMIFGAIGGIGGFILFALFSVFLSGLYNLVSFVFGGIRFKVKQ